MLHIHPSARIKVSPFHEATLAEGLQAVSVYNGMMLPTSYGDPEAEYWRLIEGVAQWDVAAERQVQIKGPDAARLAQMLTVRDLSNCRVGQGKYAPICDHRGTILNDPVCLKLADDLFWFSIADSDMWLWARAVAAQSGLDVEVSEPDVSPMAIQGPRAEDVVASVCGDWVRELKYFWFQESEIATIPVAVQRSGWSKQGGFEIYLRDGTRGTQLWNLFKEAGQPFGIGPGTPATAERVESGLVSVGGDTDGATSPLEIRLGRFVDLDVPDDTIGVTALRDIHAAGAPRHQLGVVMDGAEAVPFGHEWEPISVDGRKVGDLTTAAWSPRLKANIGYALVSRDVRSGASVTVQRAQGTFSGTLRELPFL